MGASASRIQLDPPLRPPKHLRRPHVWRTERAILRWRSCLLGADGQHGCFGAVCWGVCRAPLICGSSCTWNSTRQTGLPYARRAVRFGYAAFSGSLASVRLWMADTCSRCAAGSALGADGATCAHATARRLLSSRWVSLGPLVAVAEIAITATDLAEASDSAHRSISSISCLHSSRGRVISPEPDVFLLILAHLGVAPFAGLELFKLGPRRLGVISVVRFVHIATGRIPTGASVMHMWPLRRPTANIFQQSTSTKMAPLVTWRSAFWAHLCRIICYLHFPAGGQTRGYGRQHRRKSRGDHPLLTIDVLDRAVPGACLMLRSPDPRPLRLFTVSQDRCRGARSGPRFSGAIVGSDAWRDLFLPIVAFVFCG